MNIIVSREYWIIPMDHALNYNSSVRGNLIFCCCLPQFLNYLKTGKPLHTIIIDWLDFWVVRECQFKKSFYMYTYQNFEIWFWFVFFGFFFFYYSFSIFIITQKPERTSKNIIINILWFFFRVRGVNSRKIPHRSMGVIWAILNNDL